MEASLKSLPDLEAENTTLKAPVPARGVSLRCVLIGLALLWPNAWWLYQMAVVKWNGFPTSISLFFNSILFLLLFIALNGVLRRIAPRLMFSQVELLTIYVILNIGSCLIGHDMLQVLVPVMVHPYAMATPENGWAKLILPYMKPWLSVSNHGAVSAFYEGHASFLAWENLRWWLIPLAAWSAFTLALVLSMLCLVVLLRKQWTDSERLTYPLVQLPLDMTAPGAPLFRSRLMWTGFAVAGAIDLWNGLTFFRPELPMIPIKTLELTPLFSTHPWDAVGTIPIRFYPFALGLGILLPVDLLFSCWFFFLSWKTQYVVSAAYALDTPGAPYVTEQSFGGYIGIAVFSLWMARRHIMRVLRGLVDWKRDLEDRSEPVSYRTASLGFIVGTLFMIGFAYFAGMRLWIGVCFFAIYWLLALSITRMRAELGPPAHDLHFSGPDHVLATVIGPAHVDKPTLNALTQFFWFNRAYRSLPMPFQLESYKMAQEARISYRGLTWAIVAATVVGIASSFWAILTLCYKYGAGANVGPPNIPLLFGNEAYLRLDGWLKAAPDAGAQFNSSAGIVVGLLVTLLLNTLRTRLLWFPFHPVGYAVSSSWSMDMLWFPLFTAWVLKLLIVRYGGLRLYRKALPFFMGLILGECVVGGLWPALGILLNKPTYVFWPD